MQYTIGIATGVPAAFLSVGPDNTDMIDGFMDMVSFLLSMDTLPGVVTITYGFDEPTLQASLSMWVFPIIILLAKVFNRKIRLDAYATHTWPWALEAFRLSSRPGMEGCRG